MQIRKAVVEDAPALARIQVDSYRSAYAGILPDEFLAHFTYAEQAQDWRDLVDSEGPALLLVAVEEDGRICGYALGNPAAHSLPGCDSELDAIHVRKERHGSGVGHALIRAMAQLMREAGCDRMGLWVLAQNIPARAFYERMGGQYMGERTILLGDDDIRAQEVSYSWPEIDVLCAEK
jgi:GNAT superfamily N-acetyltransferase